MSKTARSGLRRTRVKTGIEKFAGSSLFLLVGATAGHAEEPASIAPDSSAAVIQQYCTNIRDEAAEAGISRQMKLLSELEQEVEDRIAKLEAERSDFEEWLQRREKLLAQAEETLVSVYAKMRPDAAAAQLTILDAEMAAAVLSSLQPRIASAILNEMEPQRAADLALAISGPIETAEVASK